MISEAPRTLYGSVEEMLEAADIVGDITAWHDAGLRVVAGTTPVEHVVAEKAVG